MPDKDAQAQEDSQAATAAPLPGELLTSARRTHGWTLERVAQELNLDAGTVLALEESRFEALGAPVFARGHLRKYAELLGIDTAELVTAYDAVAGEEETTELSQPAVLSLPARSPGLRLGPVVALLVVAALAVVLWRIVGNGATESDETPREEARRMTDREPLGESGSQVVNLPDAPQTRDSAPIPAEDRPPSTVEPERRAGTVEIEDAATTTAAGALPAVAVTSPQPQAERTPQPLVEDLSVAPPIRLAMRFSADSWVEVRDADGDRLIYQLQRAGSERSVTGTPPFRLFLGFADGVTIEVDGQPLTIPANRRLGNTARFQIPLEPGGVNRR